MKLIKVTNGGVQFEMDAADLCQLADAIGVALDNDMKCNYEHLKAMGAAFRAASVVAAFDTIRDSQVPEKRFLAHVREVWGPVDSHDPQHRRVVQEP